MTGCHGPKWIDSEEAASTTDFQKVHLLVPGTVLARTWYHRHITILQMGHHHPH